MKKRISVSVHLMLILSLFLLWGCPKKAEVSGTGDQQQTAASAPKEEPKQEVKIEPVKEVPAPPKEEVKERPAAAAAPGLQPIYFDFDKSYVRADMLSTMKANAEWLKANPKAAVRIEGNCDERGTIEYNQALGQRRAQSAKKYLTDLGISGKRISLIAYGKEKPVCSQSTEDCWQKNRRDDFIVVTK